MWDGQDEKTGNRVFRGGSWNFNAGYCAVGIRSSSYPTFSSSSYGFRLALSSDP
jgi:formylglycine-generating enzyme required for sulfatase activity